MSYSAVVMKVVRVEASGVRTTAAATVPLVAGQILGMPALGLAVGLGGLYLSVTDKEGSTLGSLVCAALLNGAAVLAGCSPRASGTSSCWTCCS